MKKNAEHAAKLSKLLKQLRRSVDLEPLPERTPLEHLVYAFLCWNTTRNQADQAFNRLKRATVSLNDLRVTDPLEIAEILGNRYAKAEERAQRLVMVLHGVYKVEHAMEMDTIAAMPKREARTTLEAMEGMVPFVSASVLLLGLGAHAIPVDDQLVTRLKIDGVVEDDATVEQVQSFCEHQIRAGEGVDAHQLLRAYAERAAKVELDAAAKKAGTGRKTTKKSTKTTRKTGTSKARSAERPTKSRKKTKTTPTKKKKATARR